MLIEINLAPGAGGRAGLRNRIASFGMPAMPSFGVDLRWLLGGAAGLALLLLLGWGYLRMGSREASLEASIAREVADSTRYASMIELVNSVQAREDTIQQKIGVIRSVDTRRYVWPHLLDEIGLALPAYTWLTEVRTTMAVDSLGVGPSFAIQGNAGSTQALTRFMKNLESSMFIGNVTLVTSEQDVLEGRTIQRFTLEATYRQPPASALTTVPILTME